MFDERIIENRLDAKLLAADVMQLSATEWNAVNNLKGDDRVYSERTQLSRGSESNEFNGQIIVEWSVFPGSDQEPQAARVTACSEDHEEEDEGFVLILL